MTVASTAITAHFSGSGSTGPFTFDFRFFANSEISVVKTTPSAGATVLAEGADYDLSGAASYAGGSVTLLVALETGETLDITRSLPLTQTTSIRNQGAFFPEIHEDVFDRLTMQLQQVAATVSAASATTIVEIDATDGDQSYVLPGSGDIVVVKTDTSANTVTITDGGAEYVLTVQRETVHLVFYGTNWNEI
jgi:hypothetical protein